MKKLLFLFVALLGAGIMYFAYAQSNGFYICVKCGEQSSSNYIASACPCGSQRATPEERYHSMMYVPMRDVYVCRYCGKNGPYSFLHYSCSGGSCRYHVPK